VRRAYAFTRPVPNSYLTRERDRRRRKELGWVLLVALPAGIFGLVNVWLHYELLATGYNIPRLERTLEDRLETERRLGFEAAALASPDRIEARAVEELGMEVPSASQVLFEEQLP
jgi:cell division protein FtsL